MKASLFTVRSLVVKTMTIDGKPVYRHFFEWADRKSLDKCYLRLLLIRQDGTSIGKMHDLVFAKVKLLGKVNVEQDGVQVEKPYYDQRPHFWVDADEIAAGFEYYTAKLMHKGDPRIDTISQQREDLTIFEK